MEVKPAVSDETASALFELPILILRKNFEKTSTIEDICLFFAKNPRFFCGVAGTAPISSHPEGLPVARCRLKSFL
jgi:hypothetical protein